MAVYKQIMFKYIVMPVMELIGKMHSLDVGAKRYVDTLLLQDDVYKSGVFMPVTKACTTRFRVRWSMLMSLVRKTTRTMQTQLFTDLSSEIIPRETRCVSTAFDVDKGGCLLLCNSVSHR